MDVDHQKIETAARMILEAVGEDPDREGLADTPARIGRMYADLGRAACARGAVPVA